MPHVLALDGVLLLDPELAARIEAGELLVHDSSEDGGVLSDAQRLLDPIRALNPAADLFGSMPYTAFQMMFDAEVPAGRRYYFKGGHTTGCSDVMVEAIVEGIRARPSLSSEYHLHHMGGTIARVGAGDTAFADRDAAFTFNIIGNLAS